MASTVAHSDIVTSSLAGPGTATTAARSDILPVGVPLPWLTGTPPSGFILMDGSNVSRTTYAPLFTLWGTTYGVGDGTTTFGLPDWRGRSLIGAGLGVYSGATTHTLGSVAGEESHALTTAELAAHNHGNTTDVSADHTHTPAVGTYGQVNNFANESTGLGGGSVGPGGRGTPASSGASNGHVHGTSNTGSGTAHNTYHPVFATNWIVRAL